MKKNITKSKNLWIEICYDNEKLIDWSLLWWQKQENLLITKKMNDEFKKRWLNRDIKNSIDFKNENDEISVKVFFFQQMVK